MAKLIGARVYHSATQSIPNATSTYLTFDSERTDSDGIHDGVNPTRLTCQTDGEYYIFGFYGMIGSNNGIRQQRIVLNRTTVLAQEVKDSATAWEHFDSIQAGYDLIVGDYVEFQLYQNSGGALNVLADAAFGMRRIG